MSTVNLFGKAGLEIIRIDSLRINRQNKGLIIAVVGQLQQLVNAVFHGFRTLEKKCLSCPPALGFGAVAVYAYRCHDAAIEVLDAEMLLDRLRTLAHRTGSAAHTGRVFRQGRRKMAARIDREDTAVSQAITRGAVMSVIDDGNCQRAAIGCHGVQLCRAEQSHLAVTQRVAGEVACNQVIVQPLDVRHHLLVRRIRGQDLLCSVNREAGAETASGVLSAAMAVGNGQQCEIGGLNVAEAVLAGLMAHDMAAAGAAAGNDLMHGDTSLRLA